MNQRSGICPKCNIRELTTTSGWCSNCTWRAKADKNRDAMEARLVEGCTDCGLKDERVLEFDHRPELGEKVGNIASMLNEPLWKFRAELAKCDVVCANCHRIRTRGRVERSETGRPAWPNQYSEDAGGSTPPPPSTHVHTVDCADC